MEATGIVARGRRVSSLQIARWTTAAWGLLHVVGGALIMLYALTDGPRAALEDLGSATPDGNIPAEPGSVVEGVIAFHGLNIVWFGLAVLVLLWRRDRGSLRDALFVMAAADIGLLLFLVGPGYMRLGDGIWGPALLLIAAAAFVRSRRDEVQAGVK